MYKAQAVLNRSKKQALEIQNLGFFQNDSIISLILREFFSGISGEFEIQVLKQYQVSDWKEIISF